VAAENQKPVVVQVVERGGLNRAKEQLKDSKSFLHHQSCHDKNIKRTTEAENERI